MPAALVPRSDVVHKLEQRTPDLAVPEPVRESGEREERAGRNTGQRYVRNDRLVSDVAADHFR